LNFPADCAVTIVPRTFVPIGNTTLASTVTGSASDAAKLSPLLAILELMVWSSVTVSTLPAGTSIGGSGVGAGCAGAPFCPFGAVEFAELAAELFASDEFVVEVAG
jgi:hypothetical protein